MISELLQKFTFQKSIRKHHKNSSGTFLTKAIFRVALDSKIGETTFKLKNSICQDLEILEIVLYFLRKCSDSHKKFF